MQPLKWGILGTASIAKRSVMPGIAQSETGVIHAVASRSLEKARELANAFSVETAYGSYEELLADSHIHAVYIPLPNHLHKKWVIEAAKAGKHVLCEKPLAMNAQEAEEMRAACKEQGVLLVEAFMYRYQPRYLDIKKRIAEGEIGELRGIRAAFSFNNADDHSNFRMKRDYGGGSLYDVGVYPISLARMIFEEEPEAATVHGFLPASHDHVDMVAAGLLEFSNGKFLTFDSGLWAAGRNEAEILGTEGRIVIPLAFTGDTEGYTLDRQGERREMEGTSSNHYALQADAFAKDVFGSGSVPYGAEDAVKNMNVLDACLTSITTRERVTMTKR
ncbi:Gfo/Idh/MocA family protein [Shouchella shacheensis]|uniref:Gfo/Idh/MocA family protein n=1 Tax=Shouchella shacheensis TaxID=1649580 RepID=UPI00074039DE|nr:Gfo/Idh/MocA family oxidoreductase [Shouchella shacheensis]